MQDRDTALAWVLRFFGLLLLLLVFLDFKLVDKLIHLEEAIFLLAHNHLILKHVLVRCDPDKGHGQLLGAQTCELARVHLSFCLISERDSALLVWCLLEQVGVGLTELSGVIVALGYVGEHAATFVF